MKKMLATLITICLFVLVGSTCFAAEGKVDNYQDVFVEVNGKILDVEETSEEEFRKELKGINKLTIFSMKTDDNQLEEKNFHKALLGGNYYYIIMKPDIFGEDDKDMLTTVYLIELE